MEGSADFSLLKSWSQPKGGPHGWEGLLTFYIAMKREKKTPFALKSCDFNESNFKYSLVKSWFPGVGWDPLKMWNFTKEKI